MELNLASAVFGALMTSCFIVSGFFLTQEIGEVNRKLPDDQQISYWGIQPTKYQRIKREYRRLYPGGRTHMLGNIFGAAGFVFLLLTAIAAGFFR